MWCGPVRSGVARQGILAGLGVARRGMARRGKVWRGAARLGGARRGKATTHADIHDRICCPHLTGMLYYAWTGIEREAPEMGPFLLP